MRQKSTTTASPSERLEKNIRDNTELLTGAVAMLQGWDRILNALVIDPKRALEERNSDWTASQELADVLMRKYRLPFRVGHHFASKIVDYAKPDIRPSDFPYGEAKRIYVETLQAMHVTSGELPMNEQEFRATLDPVAIVRDRVTSGGPQPSEMTRMLGDTDRALAMQDQWIKEQRARIDTAIANLDHDFVGILARAR